MRRLLLAALLLAACNAHQPQREVAAADKGSDDWPSGIALQICEGVHLPPEAWQVDLAHEFRRSNMETFADGLTLVPLPPCPGQEPENPEACVFYLEVPDNVPYETNGVTPEVSEKTLAYFRESIRGPYRTAFQARFESRRHYRGQARVTMQCPLPRPKLLPPILGAE